MSDLIIPTTENEELIIDAYEEDELQIDNNDSGVKLINDYDQLKNKPKIEGNVLVGDKTFEDLGLSELTNTEIQDIINSLR